MDMTTARKEIDAIDEEITRLFCRRMALSREIAVLKEEKGLPTYVPEREKAVLEHVKRIAGSETAQDVAALYEAIFSISRAAQNKLR